MRVSGARVRVALRGARTRFRRGSSAWLRRRDADARELRGPTCVSGAAEMCEQADEELRSRYGENFKLSPAQRLKIKLRGKKKRFDSADWAISLQSEHKDENDS